MFYLKLIPFHINLRLDCSLEKLSTTQYAPITRVAHTTRYPCSPNLSLTLLFLPWRWLTVFLSLSIPMMEDLEEEVTAQNFLTGKTNIRWQRKGWRWRRLRE